MTYTQKIDASMIWQLYFRNNKEFKMPMKDPLTITPEEDEEQMIMRRLRNSCDELKRGYRCVSYLENNIKFYS